MENVLIAETDRIGDVILSLPVFKTLKKFDKNIKITALVSPYTKEIFKCFKYVDDIIEYFESPKNYYESMLLKISSRNFDTAIVLHPDYKVAKALKKCKIPKRISYGFRWYQFLFTDVLIQHRSKNFMHQLEYNLEILKLLGIEKFDKGITLKPCSEDLDFIKKVLSKYKILNKKIIGVHPGSGKSSIGLNTKKYIELLKKLKNEFRNAEIIITHTKNDKNIIEEIIKNLDVSVNIMPANLNLSQLIALISLTNVFISNSTGPLHIASALRIPVVGFYSPVFIHSPIRWGPYWGKKLVIKPDVNCPEKWKCKKEKCKYYDCFDNISFEKVSEFIKKYL
jgi:ADP-heptose:LPS heptosyltransferase